MGNKLSTTNNCKKVSGELPHSSPACLPSIIYPGNVAGELDTVQRNQVIATFRNLATNIRSYIGEPGDTNGLDNNRINERRKYVLARVEEILRTLVNDDHV